jgi:hypothetical protein
MSLLIYKIETYVPEEACRHQAGTRVVGQKARLFMGWSDAASEREHHESEVKWINMKIHIPSMLR